MVEWRQIDNAACSHIRIAEACGVGPPSEAQDYKPNEPTLAVVAVHGAESSLESFTRIAYQLIAGSCTVASPSRVRVFGYDIRGHGRSNAMTGCTAYDHVHDCVAAIRAVVNHIHAYESYGGSPDSSSHEHDQPASDAHAADSRPAQSHVRILLLGHSVGGAIAAKAALQLQTSFLSPGTSSGAAGSPATGSKSTGSTVSPATGGAGLAPPPASMAAIMAGKPTSMPPPASGARLAGAAVHGAAAPSPRQALRAIPLQWPAPAKAAEGAASAKDVGTIRPRAVLSGVLVVELAETLAIQALQRAGARSALARRPRLFPSREAAWAWAVGEGFVKGKGPQRAGKGAGAGGEADAAGSGRIGCGCDGGDEEAAMYVWPRLQRVRKHPGRGAGTSGVGGVACDEWEWEWRGSIGGWVPVEVEAMRGASRAFIALQCPRRLLVSSPDMVDPLFTAPVMMGQFGCGVMHGASGADHFLHESSEGAKTVGKQVEAFIERYGRI